MMQLKSVAKKDVALCLSALYKFVAIIFCNYVVFFYYLCTQI